jgi:hypothetical protein
VIGGIKVHGGMPSFADLLNAEDLHAIQAFILERARLSAAADAAP